MIVVLIALPAHAVQEDRALAWDLLSDPEALRAEMTRAIKDSLKPK